ncbi:MAG: SDR family oxidoreductase [Chloroflexi bacterium]|nr:SDR family NAD(P)-dependent oxidoreductase [Chloroflexota bacterium]MQC26185.1 SDR family oxidoreductase [Chloroflexota bacterium]
MSVRDRVVVVSGATGGLGRVVTQRFAQEGAKLALLGRSLESLDALAQEYELDESQILTYALDLSAPEATTEAATAVLEKFGRIEVLLNLVGGWVGGKALIDTEADELEDMIEQHIRASYNMLKAFVPPMVRDDWGRVLAVSSPSGSRPPGRNALYAVGKAGMEALMLSLANEVRGSGVTANLVLVDTIDTKHAREKNPTEKNQSWTTPEEITATLLHLCSKEAGIINGARIPLFGQPH